jgi:hypothetical protein
MKFSALGVLDTMNRPDPAIFSEVFRDCGVPVTSLENGSIFRQELFDKSVEWFHDFISMRDCQSAARTEVVLDIDDYQGLFFSGLHVRTLAQVVRK